MKEILRKQIKLLKFGLKSPAVHDRFQKEKELALCKHL